MRGRLSQKRAQGPKRLAEGRHHSKPAQNSRFRRPARAREWLLWCAVRCTIALVWAPRMCALTLPFVPGGCLVTMRPLADGTAEVCLAFDVMQTAPRPLSR